MTSLKALLLAATAVVTASAALAADLPSRRAAPAPFVAAVPAFTWTGFYVGVNAGAAFDFKDSARISYGPAYGTFTDTTVAGFNNRSDEASFTGGGQIGYNHQFGRFVAGIEADFNYIDLDSRRAGSTTVALGPFGSATESLSGRTSIDWFGTVRGRLGFLATDSLLVYGTGGLAYANVESHASADYTLVAPPFGTFNSPYRGTRSDTRTGYTVGGGVEYAFTPNISLKGEYLYVDLGRDSVTASYTGTGSVTPGDTFSISNKTSFSVARAGLNWKFNTFGY